MSLRTPLGKVRGLGSAKGGTHHWWMQRVSAVALIPLLVWFVASILQLIGADHATVTSWIAQPLVSGLLILLIGAGFYHLRLGLQVVIEDYVHTEMTKIALLMAISFGCIVVGLWSILSILQIMLGS